MRPSPAYIFYAVALGIAATVAWKLGEWVFS
jgi:hypothetical protein